LIYVFVLIADIFQLVTKGEITQIQLGDSL
jgi:hypothetical protein